MHCEREHIIATRLGWVCLSSCSLGLRRSRHSQARRIVQVITMGGVCPVSEPTWMLPPHAKTGRASCCASSPSSVDDHVEAS
ncbi:hypothetical protein K461DRAFT_124953 [Myriangium duriaei CBS 260.36]|uniref:Uncharacterized protein n=1 Tax=Myriangium duriaei CBS 260.36 TaxID=1168546 RepID=A0A9P4J6R3_9PEZI|nr:hypothetical protein K461DRAFT_124953 [Myriangium duriaei CBS 260.36]